MCQVFILKNKKKNLDLLNERVLWHRVMMTSHQRMLIRSCRYGMHAFKILRFMVTYLQEPFNIFIQIFQHTWVSSYTFVNSTLSQSLLSLMARSMPWIGHKTLSSFLTIVTFFFLFFKNDNIGWLRTSCKCR